MTTTTVYAEIVKHYRDDEGNLIVEGSATNPSLDLDEQICDPTWLKSAMPSWFEWGNVREQHTAIAAGVGTELTQDGDNWLLRSKVVDPISAKKVENDVLKGYSIGIKNPRVITDKAAPGGRIVGGQIVEVSLVDRPCNPTCTLTVTKSAKPGSTVKAVDLDRDHMLVKVEEYTETEAPAEPEDEKSTAPDVEKRDFSAAERDAAADSGAAMPDGSFPIKSVQDLRNAIRAIGRAKNPAKAKAHIKSRAKALGKPDLIPEDWKGADADLAKDDGEEETHDPAEIAAVRDGLVALIKAELDELVDGEDELCDVQELLCSLKMLMCWWEHEAAEGEVPAPFPGSQDNAEQLVTIPLAAEPDTPKTPEPDATKTASGPDLAELVKAEVRKAIEASEERVKTLEAQLAKVLATPVPGGPALTRHTDDEAAAQQLAKATEAARYLRLADTVTDREMAQYYRTKAGQLTAPASEGARQ